MCWLEVSQQPLWRDLDALRARHQVRGQVHRASLGRDCYDRRWRGASAVDVAQSLQARSEGQRVAEVGDFVCASPHLHRVEIGEEVVGVEQEEEAAGGVTPGRAHVAAYGIC